jgi:amino acid adenylation domain-containing protein
VASVFSEVLGVDRVGLDDDFFALGGDSLVATRVAARIGRSVGVEVPVRELFLAPTVAELAARIEDADLHPFPELSLAVRPERIPLSIAQTRIWFLNRLDPMSAAYNVPLVFKLRGDLDIVAFENAVSDLLERHESLRTVFPDSDDGPHQVIRGRGEFSLDVAVHNVTTKGLADQLTDFAQAPFDVRHEIPIRVRVFCLDPTTHVVAFGLHHIAMDGMSVTPFVSDLATAYQARVVGKSPSWTPLPLQYADFAVWQRSVLGTEDDPHSSTARQLEFWREVFTGLPDVLELPTDRNRPRNRSLAGDTISTQLDPELYSGLRSLARTHGCTMFMVVHAALAVLLSRLGSTADIVIGTPMAGRRGEVDELVGMFVNTLALRTTHWPTDSFDAVLARCRDTDLDAFVNADVPFDRIVESLNPPRSTSHTPLFQVVLTHQNPVPLSVPLPGLDVEAVDLDVYSALFDLQFSFLEPLDGPESADAEVALTYATDIFDRGTAERMLYQLTRILRAVADDAAVVVGDIAILSQADTADFVPRLGGEAPARQSMRHFLHRAVEVAPSATAVRSGDQSITYTRLDELSDRVASYLAERGAVRGAVVALVMPRSIDLQVAIWGIVKAGCMFLPIDPSLRAHRVRNILVDAGATLVISNHPTADADSDVFWWIDFDGMMAEIDGSSSSGIVIAADIPGRVVRPDDPAYIIYTSGSTGSPKGVVVTHAAVSNFAQALAARCGDVKCRTILNAASPGFDASILEMLWAVTSFAELVIAPEGVYGGRELAELMRRERVDGAFLTPAVAGTVPVRDVDLNLLIVGGDHCSMDVVERWADEAMLLNAYGPTESAVATLISDPLSARETSIRVGRPVPGTSAIILDSRLRPVPPGVDGELYLAGEQLAEGYLGRTDMTAERFVAAPFGQTGQRMYRTGDAARWHSDGQLEILGRVDSQVKLRGLRIELGEIEHALAADPSVGQAAVTVHGFGASQRLVAYVVARNGHDAHPAALRTWCAHYLPDYMVPHHIVVVEALPLTVSGKLDRDALPRPDLEAPAYREPAEGLERDIAQIFGEVLGIDRIGADDNFFDVGGDSLSATRVVGQLGEDIGALIPVRLVFEAPSVAELAAATEVLIGAGDRQPLLALPRPDRLPLSFAQARMWFFNQFEPSSPAYNIPLALRLSGTLDVEALQSALADVVDRHEALRTVFPTSDGEPEQLILPSSSVPLSISPTDITERDVSAEIYRFVTCSFDLGVDVPIRVELLRLSEEEYVFVAVLHHIAADGSSVSVLARDLMLAYEARRRGEPPAWAPLRVQYADYALHQRSRLGALEDPSSAARKQVAFWEETLAGLPDLIAVPTDRPRPPVQSLNGATVEFDIDERLRRALGELARAHGATMFMAIHTALAVLLSRLSGQKDIAIGTPIAGRGERVLDDLVGMFVNTLVLRADVEPSATFAGLLERVAQTDLVAFDHADLPFEGVVEQLSPSRTTAHSPLFQVMLVFQNFTDAALELAELTASEIHIGAETSRFDLELTVVEPVGESVAEAGMSCVLTYATDLFDESTMSSFCERFIRVIESVVADPQMRIGDIDLLDEAERKSLRQWNDTARAVPAQATLVSLFDAQVAATPDATAVVYGDTRLTYQQFSEQVNRLARFLIAQNIGPECVVGVLMRRSIEMVVAVHAIVAAGAAYVPIDPDHPADRIEHILGSARPVCVLTATDVGYDTSTRWRTISTDALGISTYPSGAIRDDERVQPLLPQHPAYVIYTSGSTGQPKGITLTHAATVSQLTWCQSTYPLDTSDAVLHKTPFMFDISVWELFWTLQTGARLVIAPPDTHANPHYLASLIDIGSVTTVHFVPSMLAAFLAAVPHGVGPSLRRVFVAGEALPADLVKRFTQVNSAELHNWYGPAEAEVATAWPARPDTTSSIGAPVWNVRAFVLDDALHPVPPNVVGELYLSGAQLARGYHGRADLTGERFVANPFSTDGERMYRTGDLVRWLHDGNLEYVGRSDFQVKLRGQRLEPGDIESKLLALPGVEQAAVVVHHDAAGGDRLIAYVAGTGDGQRIRTSLTTVLPTYMVPSQIVVLDQLPLTSSGKIDRRSLPAPAVESTTAYRAPSTDVERTVANIVAETLGAEQVGMDDSFFELGGNSMSATRVIARINEELNVGLMVRDIFEEATVAGLASRARSGALNTATTFGPKPPDALVPIAAAQHRMWYADDAGPTQTWTMPFALRMTGDVDIGLLVAAITDVVERHDILRTTFPESGGVAVQRIPDRHSSGFQVERIAVGERDISDLVSEFVRQPFDVRSDLPIRAAIFDVDDDDMVIALAVSHIAVDDVALRILTAEIVEAIAARAQGRSTAYDAPDVQFSDYAFWLHQRRGSASDPSSELTRKLQFWTRELADRPHPLNIRGGDRSVVRSGDARAIPVFVEPCTHKELLAVAASNGTTLFGAIQTAFAILVSFLSGERDVTVATSHAGRDLMQVQTMIGNFAIDVPLRLRIEPDDTFDTLVRKMTRVALAAFENCDVSEIELKRHLEQLGTPADRGALFQATLVLLESDTTSADAEAGLEGLEGLAITDFDCNLIAAKHDLEFSLTAFTDEANEPSGIRGIFVSPIELFTESQAQRLATLFIDTLRGVAQHPAKVPSPPDLSGL